jgi:hypothetical protein
MALGRGKYGGVAEELAARFNAKGIIIAIIDGEKGNGIELFGPGVVHASVPGFLEALAKDIRAKSLADAAALQAAVTPGPLKSMDIMIRDGLAWRYEGDTLVTLTPGECAAEIERLQEANAVLERGSRESVLEIARQRGTIRALEEVRRIHSRHSD